MTPQVTHLSVQGLVAIVCFLSLPLYAQQVESIKNGSWDDPSVWSGGIIPDQANSTSIAVAHSIALLTNITVDEVTVSGALSVGESANLTIAFGGSSGLMITAGELDVYGIVTCMDNTSLAGTTAANTTFYDGSHYVHLSQTEGVVPLATWMPASTFELRGITTSATMQSANWSQAFGNFIYDCPNQGAFVEFRGQLQNIAGNFIISSSGGNFLKLAPSQDYTLHVGGNLIVANDTKVWFSQTGLCNINVLGNFEFSAQPTAASYLTTTGNTTLTVEGDFVFNGNSPLRMASKTANGHSNLILNGDFLFTYGTIDALETGSGTITFNKAGEQNFISNGAAVFEEKISFVVATTSTLNLGTNILTSTNGNFQLDGTLKVGSLDPLGALRNGGGNVVVTEGLLFGPQAWVEYSGQGEQFIGDAHISPSNIRINNANGVKVVSDGLMFETIDITAGQLDLADHIIGVNGDISASFDQPLIGGSELILSGSKSQNISSRASTFETIRIQKDPLTSVTLSSPLFVNDKMLFETSNVTFSSNGHLHLVSQSQTQTGKIGPLINNNQVLGAITVERFMEGIGKAYRYIASPVNSATVQSWKKYFPITGTFADPSIGVGMVSTNPSLFVYDETGDDLQGGWQPFPTSGFAADNLLTVGKGYSAFIREPVNSTVWQVTGEIAAGDFSFSIDYTNTGKPTEDGWNLIGNPYPCPVQWNAGTSISLYNVNTGITVRDNTIGGFKYWDGEMGDIPNGVIAIGQSFWVKAIGESPTITIEESAKYLGEERFYRSAKTVDYVQVALQGEGISDHVYLRTKAGALIGFDRFDMEKRQNDMLTLTIEDGNNHLAISAVDGAPCHLEVPLAVNLAKGLSGDFTFDVRAFGLFASSSLKIKDNVDNTLHDLVDQPYRISIAYGDSNLQTRFLLIVDAAEPNLIDVEVPELVCERSTLRLILSNQEQADYFIRDDQEQIHYSDSIKGNAHYFQSAELPSDAHRYKLIAKTLCAEKVVSIFNVEKIVIAMPVVAVDERCGKGVVKLTSSTIENSDVYWYESLRGQAPLGSGTTFYTDTLLNNTTFYAERKHVNGCVSDRASVVARIQPYDPVTLTRTDSILIASHIGGNTWYFNNEPLDEEGDRLIMGAPGTYEVEHSSDGCLSFARVEYVITSDNYEQAVTIKMFPVPSARFLELIHAPENTLELIAIFSANGQAVDYLCEQQKSDDRILVNVEQLPAGFYTIVVKASDNLVRLKFCKI